MAPSRRAYTKPKVPKKAFVIFLVALPFVQVAAAQSADDYRGGWRTNKGEAHTYEFSIRGDIVRVFIAPGAQMRRRWLLSMAASERTASLRSNSRESERQHRLSGQGDCPVRSWQSDRNRQQRWAGRGQVRAHPHQRTTIGNRVSTTQGSSCARRWNQSARGGRAATALHSAGTMEVFRLQRSPSTSISHFLSTIFQWRRY
jgi:hypothetical protein